MAKKSLANQEIKVGSTLNRAFGTPTKVVKHQDSLQKHRYTADYIERMCADLCVISTQADLNFLAYLLDMARMEAEDRSNDETIKDTIHMT